MNFKTQISSKNTYEQCCALATRADDDTKLVRVLRARGGTRAAIAANLLLLALSCAVVVLKLRLRMGGLAEQHLVAE